MAKSLPSLMSNIIPAKTGFSIGTALCPSCGSNGRTTYNLFSALFCWVRRLVPLLFHVVANVQVLKSDLQQSEGHVFLIAGSMSWRVVSSEVWQFVQVSVLHSKFGVQTQEQALNSDAFDQYRRAFRHDFPFRLCRRHWRGLSLWREPDLLGGGFLKHLPINKLAALAPR